MDIERFYIGLGKEEFTLESPDEVHGDLSARWTSQGGHLAEGGDTMEPGRKPQWRHTKSPTGLETRRMKAYLRALADTGGR